MAEIVSTCTFGVESVLKKELKRLGYEPKGSSDGAVIVSGDFEDAYLLNLSLRTANRVLMRLATFKAVSFDELYDKVYALDVKKYLPKNARFNVEKITSVHSQLFSKSDCQRIIKKALVENLKKAYHTTTLSESGANYPIFVQIKNDEVQIFLNTSGEGLNRRGYRLNKGEAPLTETLAAAIVLLSGYYGQCEFADFTCGSGTIAIEAAMIAKDMVPGLYRSFAMENWDCPGNENFALIKEKCRLKIKPLENRLLASDIDSRMIKCAKENAFRAGVGEDIAFQKMDLREFKSKKKGGIIVSNPPYGERLGDKKQSEELYAEMNKVFSVLEGWSLSVICANPEFQKNFGLKADKNRKLYNGNMLSYLYIYYSK